MRLRVRAGRRAGVLALPLLSVLPLILGVASVMKADPQHEAAPPAAEAARAPSGETGAEPGPGLLVLGTAQDGGFPHAACRCERCAAARRDPRLARRVASLAVVLPAERRVYLIDATPDIAVQLEALAPLRPAPAGRVDRSPVDGVLLTHAHVGHYLGLAHFGFEAIHTRALPTWATPRMARFLSTNGPWDQLVRLGNLELRPVEPGSTIQLGDAVAATPIAVPHRDEYSDTVAYLLRGPRRAVLYVPDTDAWRSWQPPLPERLAGVDVALLDGTFYSPEELPGRDVSKIGHPLITETMDLLGEAVRAGGLRVFFTHLNHSNPVLDAGSAARRALEARGFAVLAEGQEFPL
jgi:pyrroloquinoline quinone biosynthesis protein B